MSTNDTYTPGVYDLAAMVPDSMRGVADSLAGELAFMQTTLDDLKAHITQHGAVEWYQNGRQECWRESPAMKSYAALIPRYNATIKQLVGLIPTDTAQDMGDELDEWLRANQ